MTAMTSSHSISIIPPAADSLIGKTLADLDDKLAIFEAARQSVLQMVAERRAAMPSPTTASLAALPAAKPAPVRVPEAWSPTFEERPVSSDERDPSFPSATPTAPKAAAANATARQTPVPRPEPAPEAAIAGDDPWSLWKQSDHRDDDCGRIARSNPRTKAEPAAAGSRWSARSHRNARPTARERPLVSREEADRCLAELCPEIAKRVHIARRLDPHARLDALIATAKAEHEAASAKRSWWSRDC